MFTGLITSYSFVLINFANASVLKMFYKYAKEVENEFYTYSEGQGPKKNLSSLPYSNVHIKILSVGGLGDTNSHGVLKPICFMLKIVKRKFCPKRFTETQQNEIVGLPAPMTWLVPLMFASFWLFATGIYCWQLLVHFC